MENLSLVALTPQEIAPAQAQLASWCTAKMRALGKEYAELQANLRVAKRNRWSRGGLINAVGRTKKRISYYQKMKLAVQHGYLIVPNFDIDVIAVRVERDRPPALRDSYPSFKVTNANPELLPAGQGRYVDEAVRFIDYRSAVDDPKRPGQKKTVGDVIVNNYNEEVDFPVIGIKPQILEAAEHAMALRIFDRIGIVKGGKRSDPLLIGQLIDPRSLYIRTSPTVVSFFIAWWLNTEAL